MEVDLASAMLDARLPVLWLLLLTLAVFVPSARPARADALEEQAREAFEAGVDASRRGNWARASELFERSNNLIAKPQTLLNLAIAQVRLGRGREALESLKDLESMADPVTHRSVLDAALALRVEALQLVERARSRASARNKPSSSEAATTSEADPRELVAREAFAAGRYQDAVEIFARLYAERPHPNYLHNIGRCYQNLGDSERALASFREFLRKAESLPPETRAQVEGYIDELEAQRRLAEPEAGVASERPPHPHPEPGAAPDRGVPPEPSDPKRAEPASFAGALEKGMSARAITGLSFLGGGALALGAVTFFGVRSLQAYDRAEGACPSRRSCSEAALDERADAERHARFANASVGIGAALAVAGTWLFWADRRARRRATAAARDRPSVSLGTGLSLEGTF